MQLGHHASIATLLTHESEWRLYASVNVPSLVQIMDCHLANAKPLSEPMMKFCELESSEFQYVTAMAEEVSKYI